MSVYCAFVRPDGVACRGYASKQTGYCWHHDPAREAERATGLREGTAAPPSGEPATILPEPATLESVDDVHRLMVSVSNYLATVPRADTARAHALCTSAGVLLRSIGVRGLQQRLRTLEAELAEATTRTTELERRLQQSRQTTDQQRQTIAQLRQHLRAATRAQENQREVA